MRTSRWMLLISTLGVIALASPAVALNYGGGSDASVITNGVTCASAMHQLQQPGPTLLSNGFYVMSGSNTSTQAKADTMEHAGSTKMAQSGNAEANTPFIACSTTVTSPRIPGPVNGFY